MKKTPLRGTTLVVGVLVLTWLVVPAWAFETSWVDLNSQVISLYHQRRYEEALPSARQALSQAESLYGSEHPYTSTSLNNLAAIYYSLGQTAEAEPLYQRALAVDLKLFGEGNSRVEIDRNNLQKLQPILPPTGEESKQSKGAESPQTGKSWGGWDWEYWKKAGLTPPGNQPPTKEEEEEPVELGPSGFHGWNGSLSVLSGYRVDNVDWSIAGNIGGQNPNILSELTWNNLQSFDVNATAWLIRRRRIAFRGLVDYGWILDGGNQDSDYLSNNRRGEFSRSNNTSDDGFVLDASGGVGYPWEPAPSSSYNIRITPLLGYSYHRQHMTITDGHQTIPDTGPFAGLDSRYVTRWKGPWLGLDLSFTPYRKVQIYTGVELHRAFYVANARWNLRSDFSQPKSYRHKAHGNGVVVRTGLDYRLSNRWTIQTAGMFQDWSTDPGTDTTFFSDGTTAETRLNEVNWDSFELTLGARYRF